MQIGSINLDDEWESLMCLSGVSIEDSQPVYEDLCRAYSEPHRYFHTLTHIRQMLFWLKQSNTYDIASLWAVWFHDYIYRPGAKDNEGQSAICAESVMSKLEIDDNIINKTIAIIEATKTHAISGVDDEIDTPFMAMLDADMAILGRASEEYDAYRRQIRKEFSAIPSFLYKQGRKKFLKAVVSQTEIYKTDWFKSNFESQARENIEGELGVI